MAKAVKVLVISKNVSDWKGLLNNISRSSDSELMIQVTNIDEPDLDLLREESPDLVLCDWIDETPQTAVTLENMSTSLTPGSALFVRSAETPDSLKSVLKTAGFDFGWRGIGADSDLFPRVLDWFKRIYVPDKMQTPDIYDSLTGLPNNQLFQDRLQTAVNRVGRLGFGFGLVLLDIDHFNDLNQRWGHSQGDQALVQVASRLTENIRKSDTTARLVGDKFALILENVFEEHVILRLTKKFREALEMPYLLSVGGASCMVELGFSMGMALFPEHQTEANQLFDSAKEAFLQAKNEGGGKDVLFQALESA